jgi:hypothetical protein
MKLERQSDKLIEEALKSYPKLIKALPLLFEHELRTALEIERSSFNRKSIIIRLIMRLSQLSYEKTRSELIEKYL